MAVAGASWQVVEQGQGFSLKNFPLNAMVESNGIIKIIEQMSYHRLQWQ
jgi:hypothetical protein